MKKFLKITGISLLSVIGLVLIVAGVLVYVVFTPKRLTPVVRELAAQYITAEHKIGKVDLTFFSTFPEFGLRVDSLLIINPTEGAQSDTLLAAKQVVARIELMRLLQDGDINIREVSLQKVQLNAFLGADGQTNWDVLQLPTDTTPSDTTSEPFIRSVSLEDLRVTLDADRLSLLDAKDTLEVDLYDAEVSLTAKGDKEVAGTLEVKMPKLSASYCGTNYAKEADIHLYLPYRMALEMEGLTDIQHLALTLGDKAELGLNAFALRMAGEAEVLPLINTNLHIETTDWWHLQDLLALVPASIFEMPKDIEADGYARLAADVAGAYNDSTWPLITANLRLRDAEGTYKPLPYTLEDVKGEVEATVDLNKDGKTNAIIRSLEAKVKNSEASVTGEISDIMGKMLLDLKMAVDVNLADAAYFLPDNMHAKGKTQGTLAMRIALDDLTDMRLEKGVITGNLQLRGIDAALDSMAIGASKGELTFRIPNSRKASTPAKQKSLSWLEGCLTLDKLKVDEPGNLSAALEDVDLDVQLGNVLSNDPVIYADVDLKTALLKGKMQMKDSAGHVSEAVVESEKPAICAYVEYDTKDASKIPTLTCNFQMAKLAADYDTITARLTQPKGLASITGGRRDKSQPQLSAKLTAADIKAKMGTFAQAQTGAFEIVARAQHTTDTTNILLEWEPNLRVKLKQGKATMAGFEPEVRIPEISFAYSNRDFHIDTSRVELGHSDFSLSGKITNIGPWMEDKGLLKGDLNFYSSKTDVNELLSYVSGLGNDEEEEEPAAAATETSKDDADPFIVPKGVDMTLNTYITEASAFGQHLTNLGGRVYVRDGILIIEEMGFICEAAKLQLTAMYKTPRKSHIYAGFDYHMTDINIAELVNMIPQVDSMLPMLRSFKGKAQFHLAAETYLNSRYQLKQSTTRGACSISANDLTLLDGETFTKIAKILTFNKQTENKIDSISAEIALYKGQIDIYPFLITCDKWMGAVGGRHNLDMTFDYHASLLKPLYIGVDVKGNFDDLKITPAKCRYAKDFRPVFHKEVDTQAADIRKMIKKALEQSMK